MFKKNNFLHTFVREQFLIVLVLALATFFRLSGVLTNSFPFTYDIGRDMLVARDIALQGRIPLIGQTTGLPGLFYGPTWHYFLGFLYIPLGGNPAYFSAVIAITGVITAFLGYLLGKKITGAFLGLVLAAFIGFSPIIISLTAQIWNPTLIPILWGICLLVIYRIYRNKSSYLYPFFLGVLLSLITDMEIVVGIFFSAGIIISLFIFIPQFLKLKKIILVILGYLLIISPRIIFDFRHQHILSNTLIAGLQKMSVYGGGDSFSLFQIPQKLLIILNLWNETVSLKNPMLGEVMLMMLVVIIVIYYKEGSEVQKVFMKITIVSIGVTIGGVLVFAHDIWPHYLVALPLLFVLFFSLAINLLYINTKNKGVIILFVIFLMLVYINPLNKISEYSKPIWEGNAAVYRNQISVVDYIYKSANGEKFKYIVYTPPVHDYTYQYLFSWYGMKKYHYLPNEKDAGIMFVIMEPDFENPSRLTDWLMVRKNDGKIIKQETQKGGIIVQTRLFK